MRQRERENGGGGGGITYIYLSSQKGWVFGHRTAKMKTTKKATAAAFTQPDDSS